MTFSSVFAEIHIFTGFVKELFIYFAQKYHCQKKDYCANYQKVVDMEENMLYYIISRLVHN